MSLSNRRQIPSTAANRKCGRAAKWRYWILIRDIGTRLYIYRDDTFTCTTGFQKEGTGEQYGWRSGKKDKYFGIGNGALTLEEKQVLGHSD